MSNKTAPSSSKKTTERKAKKSVAKTKVWNFGRSYLNGIGYLNDVSETGGNTYAKITVKSGGYKGKQRYISGSFYVLDKLVEHADSLSLGIYEDKSGDAHGVSVSFKISNIYPTIYEDKVYFNGILLSIDEIGKKSSDEPVEDVDTSQTAESGDDIPL